MNIRIFIISAFLLLSACVQQQAAIENKGDKFYGWGDGSNQPEESFAPTYIVVQHGDTLLSIASKQKVLYSDLVAVNHLKPPYTLRVGQRLQLPTNQYHLVIAGDTITKIAQKYHVNVNVLAQANRLPRPYTVKKGALLKIPANRISPDEVRSLAGIDGNTYKAVPVSPVKSSISSKPLLALTGSSAAPVASTTEALTSTSQKEAVSTAHNPVQTNQVATLSPLPKTHITEARSYNKEANDAEEEKTEASPVASNPSAATPASPVAVPTPAIAPPASVITNDDTPPAAGNARFIWPVKGSILSRFGPAKGGLQNDGINIASEENAPVRASAAGTVVYAGNELRGYGNLLIIEHGNGYLTAYAHQKDVLVHKGDKVTQGQVIGHVGATGNVNRPQLHFGIRQAQKALDPEKLLAKM